MKERVARLVGGVAGGCGVDIPFRLRADPPAGRPDARVQVRVLDLRRTRLTPPGRVVCRDLDLDPKRFPPKSIRAAISNAKNELIDFESFQSQGNGDLSREGLRGLPDVPAALAGGIGDGLR